MKNNLLTTILNWILAAGLILSAVFAVQHFFRTRDLRTQSATLQQEMQRFPSNRALLNALVNEVVEFSKRDQTILPVLETIGLKPEVAAGANTNKPAAK